MTVSGIGGGHKTLNLIIAGRQDGQFMIKKVGARVVRCVQIGVCVCVGRVVVGKGPLRIYRGFS